MPHQHREDGPVCDLPTKKACDERYADWQAAQQVRLAAHIVKRGGAGRYRKDTSVFGQLVGVLAGERADILNDDGQPSDAPFTKRVRRMLAQYRMEVH